MTALSLQAADFSSIFALTFKTQTATQTQYPTSKTDPKFYVTDVLEEESQQYVRQVFSGLIVATPATTWVDTYFKRMNVNDEEVCLMLLNPGIRTTETKGAAFQLQLKQATKIHQIVLEARMADSSSTGYLRVHDEDTTFYKHLNEFKIKPGEDFQTYVADLGNKEETLFTIAAPKYVPDADGKPTSTLNSIQIRRIIFVPEGCEWTQPTQKNVIFESVSPQRRELILDADKQQFYRDNFIFLLPSYSVESTSGDTTPPTLMTEEFSLKAVRESAEETASYSLKPIDSNGKMLGVEFTPTIYGNYTISATIDTPEYMGTATWEVVFYPSVKDLRINWAPMMEMHNNNALSVSGIDISEFDAAITPYALIDTGDSRGSTQRDWTNSLLSGNSDGTVIWWKTEHDPRVDVYWEEYNKIFLQPSSLKASGLDDSPRKAASTDAGEITSDMQPYGVKGIKLEGGNVLTLVADHNGIVSPQYKVMYGEYVGSDPLGISDPSSPAASSDPLYFDLHGRRLSRPEGICIEVKGKESRLLIGH